MPTIKFIKKYAKDKGFKLPKKGKKAIYIHAIQEQEGNLACYATKNCDNMGCLWFKDCQKEYNKQ